MTKVFHAQFWFLDKDFFFSMLDKLLGEPANRRETMIMSLSSENHSRPGFLGDMSMWS